LTTHVTDPELDEAPGDVPMNGGAPGSPKRRLFAEPGFAALVGAETVSSLGSRMTYLALPWFVLVTAGSAGRMSIVLAVELLPAALFGFVGATVVARLGSRTTMLVSDLARGILVALVPALHLLGVLSYPVLLVIVFGIGSFGMPYLTAQRLLLPDLLGEDESRITGANSVVETLQRTTGLVGPALAGVLIGVFGAIPLLWLDAGSFLSSFLIVATLVPRVSRAGEALQRGRHAMRAALRFLLGDWLLRPVVVAIALFGIFFPVLYAALPVLAYEEYGHDATTAGIFFAALAAGQLAGSALAYVLSQRVQPARLLVVSALGLALPLWVLPNTLPEGVIAAAVLVSGFFAPLANIPIISMLTLRPPASLRPAVLATATTMNALAGPAGLALAGPLFVVFSVRGVLVAIAAGTTAVALMFVFAVRRAQRVA
jgi:hypothetical protein